MNKIEEKNIQVLKVSEFSSELIEKWKEKGIKEEILKQNCFPVSLRFKNSKVNYEGVGIRLFNGSERYIYFDNQANKSIFSNGKISPIVPEKFNESQNFVIFSEGESDYLKIKEYYPNVVGIPGFGKGKIYYNADTSNGNSGSPIILAGTNRVIGIHTNGGGCYRQTRQNSPRGNHGQLFSGREDLRTMISECLAWEENNL
ncbi:hypothetical protein N9N67_01655 [Bacteriovoracaceae bacterium]|nr:hypothetical protein [Bacteriovoracaceae bacterium]